MFLLKWASLHVQIVQVSNSLWVSGSWFGLAASPFKQR